MVPDCSRFCKWNRNRTYALLYNFLLTLKTTANSNTKRRPRSSLSLLSGHLGNKLSNKKAWSWQVLGVLIFFCHFAFLFFIDPNQVDVVCINVNSGKIFYNYLGFIFYFVHTMSDNLPLHRSLKPNSAESRYLGIDDIFKHQAYQAM